MTGARAHRLAGLAVAVLVDVFAGEPPLALHPVALIGRLISLLERAAPRRPREQVAYGLVVALSVPALAAAMAAVAGRAAERVRRRFVWSYWPMGGLLLKPAFAARMLLDAGSAVEAPLRRQDLGAARAALRAMVSRDVSGLSPDLLAAAAVESLGENVSDSVIAPLIWYAIYGLPGAWAYRAINTADAMIGYRGRYEYLGKAAARLDDAANLLPARLTALLIVAAAWIGGYDAAGAWRMARRDSGLTASPNAGWPMAAFAGALGVRLEKEGHYILNREGAPPSAETIAAARRLAAMTMALGGLVAALPAGAGRRSGGRR